MSDEQTKAGGLRHPKRLVKKKNVTEEMLREGAQEYLKWLAQDQPYCRNVLRGGSILLNCTCLADNLSRDDRRAAVAAYLVPFIRKSRLEQKQVLIERIQKSRDANLTHREHCRFDIPGRLESDNTCDTPKICSSALLSILGLSRHVWTHCVRCTEDVKAIDDKIMTQNGSKKSNSGNALNESIAMALADFFHIQNQLAAPFGSTNIIPDVYSKKALFEQFCASRGWTLTKTEEGVLRPRAAPGTNEPICSLSSFLAFWKKNFPQLGVAVNRSRGRPCATPSKSPLPSQYESPIVSETVRQVLDKFFDNQVEKAEALKGFQLLRNISSGKELFSHFCSSRGWEVVEDNRGAVSTRVLSSKAEPICSFDTFKAFWKAKYPQLCTPPVSSSDENCSDGARTQEVETPQRSISETTNLPCYTPSGDQPTNDDYGENSSVPNNDPKYQKLLAESEALKTNLDNCRIRLKAFQDRMADNQELVQKLKSENDHLQAAVSLFSVQSQGNDVFEVQAMEMERLRMENAQLRANLGGMFGSVMRKRSLPVVTNSPLSPSNKKLKM